MKREPAGKSPASARAAIAATDDGAGRVRPALLALGLVGAALALVLGMGAARAEGLDASGAPPSPILRAEAGPEMFAPKILSAEDVLRYQVIFELQSAGRWAAADREVTRLRNRLLIGHVLRQRYLHPTAYRSRYDELKRWLAAYADHPEANRIYALALRRKPEGAEPPRRPFVPQTLWNFADIDPDIGPVYHSDRERPEDERARVRALRESIERLARAGDPVSAEAMLNRPETGRLLDRVEFDDMRASVAAGYFFSGEDAKALALAAPSAERSRAYVPKADRIAGFAAWRLDDHETAQRHFEALARSATASSWNVAAGAYWGARAFRADDRPKQAQALLRIGAEQPGTFYGLLCARLLDRDLRLNFEAPPFTAHDLARLMRVAGVRRAIALTQIGQHELADRELINVYLHANASLGGPLLGLAYRLQLPATQLRLARGLTSPEGKPYHAALYPIPPWKPAQGYNVDRALVYALMRQESHFDTRATSSVGARGLMQLMPSTASYVAGDDRFSGKAVKLLYRPVLNLELGQRYIEHLIHKVDLGGNLFWLSAAYNGGPGNLQKWLKQGDFDEDPLLFIESIPNEQTRNYVERVLANFWIYRARLGQDLPSLDAVAAGRWPLYSAVDGIGIAEADHAGG